MFIEIFNIKVLTSLTLTLDFEVQHMTIMKLEQLLKEDSCSNFTLDLRPTFYMFDICNLQILWPWNDLDHSWSESEKITLIALGVHEILMKPYLEFLGLRIFYSFWHLEEFSSSWTWNISQSFTSLYLWFFNRWVDFGNI